GGPAKTAPIGGSVSGDAYATTFDPPGGREPEPKIDLRSSFPENRQPPRYASYLPAALASRSARISRTRGVTWTPTFASCSWIFTATASRVRFPAFDISSSPSGCLGPYPFAARMRAASFGSYGQGRRVASAGHQLDRSGRALH